VCDDGTVLMDSTLMLDYAEVLAAAKGTGRSLMPGAPAQRQHALRVVGLALAACEKSVQIIYEQTLRPAEKQHQPWLDRVQGQLLAACAALEAELKRVPPAATSDTIDQAGLTCAVAWQFMQQTRPGLVPVADHPVLQAYSEQVEQLPEFAAAPHGDGTVAARG
jgi:glutathione S-transferase